MEIKKFSKRFTTESKFRIVRYLFLTILLTIQLSWLFALQLNGQDKFCFNTYFPAPTIDGVIAGDLGWKNSNQYVFNNGSLVPHAVVQTKNYGGFIFISVEVNNDPTFDVQDVIVLTFSPDGNAVNDRRIHIFPVQTGVGNEPDAPGGNPVNVDYWTDSTISTGWNSDVPPIDPTPNWLEIKVTSSSPALTYKSYFVEIKIPIAQSAADPGINILPTGDFGFYFNIIRVEERQVTETETELVALDELRWPTDAPLIAQAFPETTIELEINTPDPQHWGDGTLDGVCPGVQVYEVYTNNTDTNAVDPYSSNNIFSVGVENTGSASASGITATIKSSRFGLAGPGSYGLIPAPGNPTPPSGSIPGNGGTATLSTGSWDLTNDPNQQDYITNPWLCSFVELNAAGGGTYITNKYFYWNLHFGTASKFSHNAYVEAIGYGAPPDGTDSHKFDLMVSIEKYMGKDYEPEDALSAIEKRIARRKGVKKLSFKSIWEKFAKLTFTVHGYRHTNRFIIIRGKKYALRESVNSFGYVIDHVGELSKWVQLLAGIGLLKTSPYTYTLSVPNNKAVELATKIRAVDLSHFAIIVRGGCAFPSGSFSSLLKPGLSLHLGLEYSIANTITTEAIVGYHQLKDDSWGSDLKVWQFSLNGRYYLMNNRLRPFVNGGSGLYILDPGDSEIGFNGGGGLQFAFSSKVSFEVTINYHTIKRKETNFEFWAAQGGLRYRF